MAVTRVYLDSNILVAHVDPQDTNGQHDKVKKFLQKCGGRTDLEFHASSWTLTEAMKVLLVEKNMNKTMVLKISEELLRKTRLANIKFNWLPAPDKPNYDLDEFFYDFQQKILQHRIGVGDLMHIVLMDLHDISTILTFNDKDFNKFREIKAIKPENFFRHKLT